MIMIHMKDMLKKLLISSILMLGLDIMYLGTTRNYYASVVQSIQKSPMTVRLFSAALTYLIMIIGLYYFILSENRHPLEAFLFGIVIYGVYEFTTYAIFNNWTPFAVVLDTIWGGCLMAMTTFFTQYIISKLN